MSLLYGFAIPAGIAAIRAFWTHAFAVGLLSRQLTGKLPNDMAVPCPETMFVAGLLHDIGKAILGIRVDPLYFEREQFRQFGDELNQAENAHYGMDHAEAGSFILTRWGIPNEIVEVVGGHHLNSGHIGAKICSIADAFAHEHLTSYDTIEAVHAALSGGLFEKAEEALQKAGMIPPANEGKEEA